MCCQFDTFYAVKIYAASSSARSGCLSISRNKHNIPGGENLPCSQSRSVATGGAMRSANACCDRPDLARAERTRICSGVVTRPVPALASASAFLTSDSSPAQWHERFFQYPCHTAFSISHGEMFAWSDLVYIIISITSPRSVRLK